MSELAAEAGITVRTLRFYRERKLIPPPRREGRIAWYNEHHLARLRTIAALLERGHNLGGIAQLLTAFESGRDVGELLGLDSSSLVAPFSEETPVRLTPEELADHFQDHVTADNLATSLDIGYLAVDGDEFVHISRRLLDASTDLVAEGVPLAAVLDAGRQVRAHADALAQLFLTVIRTHVLGDVLARVESGATLGPDELARLAQTIDKLRPLSKSIVDAELSMAMDRAIGAELASWAGGPAPAAPDADAADGTRGTGDDRDGGATGND
ncbi:MerR family transcriptional regulator [Streptomyces sp. Ru73]|nr:MerR family transcriptional regulator [Streptomyces sp. Ru73]POX41601.1 MerR family transcriptional regulator [Streptomyces sp. Ru73]